jgi:hypothetical protein
MAASSSSWARLYSATSAEFTDGIARSIADATLAGTEFQLPKRKLLMRRALLANTQR